MIKQILTFLLFFVFTAAVVQAQDIKVHQFDFATSIENRAPTGVDTTFAADIGNVYCFTHIKGAGDTQIAHVWYYKDEEKARINLDVQSDDWRTWSSKSILENWTGRWRVMVEDETGNVLDTKTFIIEE
jgi:hypothetical protein